MAKPTVKIYVGDCLDVLAAVPDHSVHCCVTSPPYLGVRDYLVDGQIGLHQTLAEYLETMVRVFRVVRQKMRPEGTLWVNEGDCYNGTGGAGGDYLAGGTREGQPKYGGRNEAGMKPKDLMMVPAELALALRRDGWYLRKDIVWHKEAPMPESVEDRPTSSHEYVFLLSPSPDYYYDGTAVREPALGTWGSLRTKRFKQHATVRHKPEGRVVAKAPDDMWDRNMRDVWTLGPDPFHGRYCAACDTYYTKGNKHLPKHKEGERELPICKCGRWDGWLGHYALMVPEVARRCILAGTSAHGVCSVCGTPWQRVEERTAAEMRESAHGRASRTCCSGTMVVAPTRKTVGWEPTCSCDADVVPATVLDPFMGAGTTGLVAYMTGRNAVGAELNPQYARLAQLRILQEKGLLGGNVEVIKGGSTNAGQ